MSKESQNRGHLSRVNLQKLFPEIDQKELKALYTHSEIRPLEPGEFLVIEGDIGKDVYLILEGALKIVHDTEKGPKKVAELRAGEWVGEIAFTKNVPRTASAVAIMPTHVMVINSATLKILSADTQLCLLKQLSDLANERTLQIVASGKELKNLNTRLIDLIETRHFREQVDYGSSPLILGIIRKIPKLPSFTGRLVSRMSQPNTNLREVGDLIKQDPSSVALILKVVNSAYYGLKQKVSDVNHALTLIGFVRVYQILVGEGLRHVMPDNEDFRALQSHSVMVSHIAYGLTLASQSGNPSEAASLGLLHDLGKGLMLLLKKQNPSLDVLIDSLDHARLNALLLKEWGMPDELVQTVMCQSYPEFLPPDRVPEPIRRNVAILYLAHQCLRLLEKRAEGASRDIFLTDYMELFGWQRLHVALLVERYLLPILSKGLKGYPVEFRRIVKDYMA